MKHTITAGTATVINLDAVSQLQAIGFRNEGTVDVFILPGEVPSPLPDLPSQGYNGTLSIAQAEFVRWNGFLVRPGEQFAFAASTTGPVPRRFTATCEGSNVTVHSLIVR